MQFQAIAFPLPAQPPMTYKDKLNPWCIIRPVSTVQMRIVGRFRRRCDAEGHLQILKRMIPDVPFEIMFDVATEDLTPKPESYPPPFAGEGLGERSTEK